MKKVLIYLTIFIFIFVIHSNAAIFHWGSSRKNDNSVNLTDNYSDNLISAIEAITSGQKLIISQPTEYLDQNITITNPVEIAPGGIIRRSAGGILHINDDFITSETRQVFDDPNNDWVRFGANSIAKITPQMFGAAGDGSTDDSRMIYRMVAACCSGQTLRFISEYKFSGVDPITIDQKNVDVEFINGAAILAQTSTAGTILLLTGALGTNYQLGGDISKNDRTMTVDSNLASSLSEGDLIKISTHPTHGGSGERWTSYNIIYKGELAEVLSISGTTVTLKNGLADDYYADSNTATMKISYIQSSISNPHIYGNVEEYTKGLRVTYAKNLRITGGEIKGFGYSCLLLDNTYGTVIDGLRASDFYDTEGTSHYGVAVYTGQNMTITNCNLFGGRHALTFIGYEPSRYCLVSNNILDNHHAPGTACLDTHPQAEFIDIHNNRVLNAIDINGRNVNIMNNDVYDSRSGGYCIRVYGSGHIDEDIEYFNIHNNNCRNVGGGSGTGINIDCKDRTINTISIKGNSISTDGVGIKISQLGEESLIINNLDIISNSINNSSGSAVAVYLHGYDNTYRLQVDRANINENSIICNANPFYYRYCNGSNLGFNRNNIKNNDTEGGYCVATASATIESVQYCDNIINNTGSVSYASLTASRLIKFNGNEMSNCTSYGGCKLVAPYSQYSGNTMSGCSGNASLGTVNFFEVFYNHSIASFYVSVPIAGTWIRGSIIFDASPTAGASSGWQCTITGTFQDYTDSGGVTDGSTSVITGLTDTSVLSVGDYVSADIGFPSTGPFRILSLTATTLTVTGTSNSAETGVTVDTSDPVFKAMSNLAS